MRPSDAADAQPAPPPSESAGAATGERIVLMGMMGAGKTTVGRLVAGRLGCPYLDNDDAVRAMTDREPAEIRASDGEDALHRLESEALAWALARSAPVVIGAAGFVADDPRAPELLAGDIASVWLRARPETLRTRIGAGEGRRTEATDIAWLTRQARERDDAYRALADLVIDVDDLSADEVADRILEWLRPRQDR
jgi:shikimate kinase